MKAILTYHSIDASGSPISVHPDAFSRHMDALVKSGTRVVHAADIAALSDDGPAVALTFDDGYTNFATAAWPILRERGFPVTVFVPTDHVGGWNRWDDGNATIPRLELLGWSALTQLAAEGVTLGSHTCTHPHLSELARDAVRAELVRSRDRIEAETGRRPQGLAYPYGDLSATVAACAAEYYDYACTTELGALNRGAAPHRLPRIDMYYFRQGDALDRWGSARMRLYLSGRAGARRCRRLLNRRGAA